MQQQYRKSKIGGQALIEGIMMRGLDQVAMAVRNPAGEVITDSWKVSSLVRPPWYRRIWIVRGVFSFLESLALGYKCLMKSAEIAGMEEEDVEQEPGWLERVFGDHVYKLAGIIGSVLGVVIAILFFMYLPSLVVKGLSTLAPMAYWVKSLAEGVIKISIFIVYLMVVSRMKEIRRTFEYHGAEHKTIACYEADAELTVENVKRHSRFHPRCGTSFLLLSLIFSILMFSVVTWDVIWLRVLLKIVLLPAVVGVTYEVIRLAGRYDNLLTRIVSAPGLWLQRLTTRDPNEQQMEVAIQALSMVIPENREEDQW